MENTFTIPFFYSLYNDGQLVCNDTINVTLSEDDVRAVAEAMTERNGGNPVELIDAANVTEKVYDAFFENELLSKLPDLDCYDYVDVELQEDMPDELVAAADRYLASKPADVNYYATVDGREYNGTVPMELPSGVFRKMVEAACIDHAGRSDFDFLKEYAPKAHELILDWTREWAFKECLSKYGVTVQAELREFPHQVWTQAA